MSVLAILQARMTSSRLPGKVLMDIEGMPMIGRQLERIKESKLIDEIVVATSTESTDDQLAYYVEESGVNIQRGPLEDVLQRFIEVLDVYDFKHIVRLTADCPLADSDVIDGTIEMYLNSNLDYVSNTLKRTFPRGLDVEVFKDGVLRDVAKKDKSAMSREHVTYGIYTRTGLYSTGNYSQNPSFANFRWTVDTQDDLDFVRQVYKSLYPVSTNFRQGEIIKWLEKFPEYANYEIGEFS
jgi:spore coat polysaccharide biosynthesis protein SpsF